MHTCVHEISHVNQKKMQDCHPGSLSHVNKKLEGTHASCWACKGSKDLSDNRMKIAKLIVDMNYKTLECRNLNNGMNMLHQAIRRNPVSLFL